MNFRTDLALERRELLTDREIPGVKSRVNQSGSVCVTAIEVQTEQGAQAIGKPVGSYITVEVPPFSADAELLDGRLSTVADELRALLPEEGLVLVVGIGNDQYYTGCTRPLGGRANFGNPSYWPGACQINWNGASAPSCRAAARGTGPNGN